jgi:hypothetical protein
MSDDPRVWFALMLKGIAGLQRGDKTPAKEYLQFVEAHRGRAVAEEASIEMRTYSKSKVFFNAADMLRKLEEKASDLPKRLR